MLPQHIRKAAETCLETIMGTYPIAEVAVSVIHEGRKHSWVIGTRRQYTKRNNAPKDQTATLAKLTKAVTGLREAGVSRLTMTEFASVAGVSPIHAGRVLKANPGKIPGVLLKRGSDSNYISLI